MTEYGNAKIIETFRAHHGNVEGAVFFAQQAALHPGFQALTPA